MGNMTKEEVLELRGRKLDAAVAEYLMGWQWDGTFLGPPKNSPKINWAAVWDENGYPDYLPEYENDMARAWTVAERFYMVVLPCDGWGWSAKVFTTCDKMGDYWRVDSIEGDVIADTASLAIYQAALLEVIFKLGC